MRSNHLQSLAARRQSLAAWRTSKRKGIEYLELILVMPVLFVATLAIFEFGILVLYQGTVTSAAVEGAREAAKSTDDTEVAKIIQKFLAVNQVIFDTATISNGGGYAYVRIERGATVGERGNLNYFASPYGPNPLTASEVRVTISTPLVAANDQPVPNWLSNFGLDLSASKIQVSSLTLAE